MEAYKTSFRSKTDLLLLEPNSDFFRYLRDSAGKATGKK
jgi:membrane protease subunit HflC